MNISLFNKQSGVTLMTSMVLLIVMTLFGVSAVKISSINTLIGGNEQQSMLISQETQTQINNFSSIINLNTTYTETGFKGNGSDANKYVFNQTIVNGAQVSKTITKMDYNYACKRKGLASGVGSGAPTCDLFDFFVAMKKLHSGAKSSRHQGAGKMLPNQLHRSDSTKGVYNFVD